MLWKTYVEYWEQWEAANTNNPVLPIIKAEKPKKIRKRRVYSLESLLRMKDKYGKPKFRNLEEEERKRLALEKKRAWSAQLLEKEKHLAAQQATSEWHIAGDGRLHTGSPVPPFNVDEVAIHHQAAPAESEILNSKSVINKPLHSRSPDKLLQP